MYIIHINCYNGRLPVEALSRAVVGGPAGPAMA